MSVKFKDGVIVMDNGAGIIKTGLAGERVPRKLTPNCLAQTRKASGANKNFVGENVFNCRSECFIHRPHTGGMLVDFETEKQVWKQILIPKNSLNLQNKNFKEMGLLMTEHYNVPLQSHLNLYEILFEDFGFGACLINQSQLMTAGAFLPQLPSEFSSNAHQVSFPAGMAGGITAPELEARTVNVWKEEYYHDPLVPVGSSSQKKDPTKYFVVGDKGNFSVDFNNENPCRLVLDMSFSGAFCIPFFRGYPLEQAAMRNTAGGSYLNDSMVQMLNFRHANLGGNVLVAERLKEFACYVPLDFMTNLKLLASINKSFRYNCRMQDTPPEVSVGDAWRRTKDIDNLFFASLDGKGVDSATGFLESANLEDKPLEPSTVVLSTERVAIPELLFHPDDFPGESYCLPFQAAAAAIGAVSTNNAGPSSGVHAGSSHQMSQTKVLMRQPAGCAEMVANCILACPQYLQAAMCSNIIVTGGSAGFPNFFYRLYTELRSSLPAMFPIRLHYQEDPMMTNWLGASAWASAAENFDQCCYTREQYLERGQIKRKH